MRSANLDIINGHLDIYIYYVLKWGKNLHTNFSLHLKANFDCSCKSCVMYVKYNPKYLFEK